MLQDPPAYAALCDAAEPPPVPPAAEGGDGEGKEEDKDDVLPPKTKKRRKSALKKPDPPVDDHVEDRDMILQSFAEGYRPIITALPACLQPSSSKHGMHSYTVFLDCDRWTPMTVKDLHCVLLGFF